jgi:hypothetical protein
LTMKWSNRIAQGFSPGWCDTHERPESGDRICGVKSRLDVTNDVKVWSGWKKRPHSVATFRAVFGLVHPGLKPWAIL